MNFSIYFCCLHVLNHMVLHKNIIIPARDNVWLEIILVINYTLKQMSYPDSGLFFVTIGTKNKTHIQTIKGVA